MINKEERIDDLHRNGRLIIQKPGRFCFGIDAVILSGFAVVKPGERALDLCAGNGVVSILLEAKTEGAFFAGIEIQEEMAELARRSVALNKTEDKIQIIRGDIKDAAQWFPKAGFDVVTANPPYMQLGGGLVNHSSPKAVARHEILTDLAGVVKAAAEMLKDGGRFYMVHRPQRLADIICRLREVALEPKTLRFVQAFSDREPMLALVEGVKNGGPMMKVLPNLVIYEAGGQYTDEIRRIYYE